MSEPAEKSSPRPRAKSLSADEARLKWAAKETRGTQNETMRRALCESMARHGYSDPEIARATGVHRQQVEGWRSERGTSLPNVAHVMCMPSPVRDDLLLAMAEETGRDLVTFEASNVPPLEAFEDVERHGSEAKVVMLRAVADGFETDAELVEQARAHRDAGDAHYRWAARCVRDLKARKAKR